MTALYVTSILAACPAHQTFQHLTTVTTGGGLYKSHSLQFLHIVVLDYDTV